MSEKTFKIVNGEVSDGYHTFDELYEHRHLLFIALCKTYGADVSWKEEPEFGDWICVYLELATGQISYHLPGKYREHFHAKQQIVSGVEVWDGHESKDVLNRLRMFAERFPI